MSNKEIESLCDQIQNNLTLAESMDAVNRLLLEQDNYARAYEFLWFTRKLREFMDTSTSPKYKVFESNFVKQYEQRYKDLLTKESK